jgi:hypothetical protein
MGAIRRLKLKDVPGTIQVSERCVPLRRGRAKYRLRQTSSADHEQHGSSAMGWWTEPK